MKRFFYDENEIHDEEFAYIHIKKRKFKDLDFNAMGATCVYICPHEFIEADIKKPITLEIINQYNHYYGRIYEDLEKNFIRKLKGKFKSAFR